MKKILVIAMVALLVCVSAFATLVNPSVATINIEPVPAKVEETVIDEVDIEEFIAEIVNELAALIESLDEETAEKIAIITSNEELSIEEVMTQLTAVLGEEKMEKLVELADGFEDIDIDYAKVIEIVEATVEQIEEDAEAVEVTEITIEDEN